MIALSSITNFATSSRAAYDASSFMPSALTAFSSQAADPANAAAAISAIIKSPSYQDATPPATPPKNGSGQSKYSGTTGSGPRPSEILFVYTSSGSLRIRFMDSTNKLIYQMPPELYSRLNESTTPSRKSLSEIV